jgi:hypothetical protein
MHLKQIASTLTLTLLLSSLGLAEGDCDAPYKRNIVHFADEHNPDNRLITVDSKNMKLLNTVEVEGSLNHHSDTMGSIRTAKYMMMVPKGSNFITIRDIKNGNFVKKIQLPFRPRSADAYNKTHDLVLLNSRDRPAAVLIDVNSLKIVGKAGFNTQCNQPNIQPSYNGTFPGLYASEDIPNLMCSTSDFGGDQISGHPIWISSNTFVLLDRSNRLLHVYSIRKSGETWKTRLVQTIKTDTALHQLIPRSSSSYNRTFYGMTESNPAQGKIAGVYKFIRIGSKLYMQKFTKLTKGVTQGINGHNLYITPDKRYLYAPVGATLNNGENKKGGIFVIGAYSMRVKKFVETGFGAGHVSFSKKYNMAMVTNHKSKYVTAINYKRHNFLKNIPLDFKSENIFSLYQSHAPYIEPNGQYFYNFWTDGGVFFRINLANLTLDKSVYTGGIPIQGNYYPTVNTRCTEANPISRPDDGFASIFPNLLNYIFRGARTIQSNEIEHAKNSNGYDK